MNPLALGLIVTGLGAALYGVLPDQAADSYLRTSGACGGALAAIASTVASARRRQANASERERGAVEFDALAEVLSERRRAQRFCVGAPLRVSVNGHSCSVTLINVSASGALLRLHRPTGEDVPAAVGQPVRLGDVQTGTVARVGAHGLYIDFGVDFQASPNGAPEPSLSPAEPS